jgi:hypothetical protein
VKSGVDGLPVREQASPSSNNGGRVKLNIEDFKEAVGIIGDGVGQEGAIVAQFALDLAVTAQFRMHEIEPVKARHLLRLRIARHRAAQQMSSVAVH